MTITVSQFFKGLLMALISVLVIAFGQVPVNYALLAVTAIATILAYTGKNLMGLFSTSEEGKFSLLNLLSSLLIALSTAITEGVGMIVFEGQILWLVLGKVVAATTLTYIAATFFGPPTTKSKKLF